MRAWPIALVVATLLASASAVQAQQYTEYGDPTSGEQLVLETINRARANPIAEGTRLGIVITEGFSAAEAANLGPRPPLSMNGNLLATARAHSQDMWTRNYFTHDTLNPPLQTWAQRIAAGGYSGGQIAENIAASSSGTPAQLEDILMLDTGYPGRGHRKTLLDIHPGSTSYYQEIGAGYYSGASVKSNAFKDLLTEDFGRRATGPFLVGVVITDTVVANQFYDIGEGVAGIGIAHDVGGSTAVTASAGGYACILPTTTTGSVTVRVTSGIAGWSATVVKKRFLTGENLKVDFISSEGLDTDGDGMPDVWEDAHGLNKNSAADAGTDADGDGATNLEEFQYGSNPQSNGSTPANPLGSASPPPPPPATKKGGGGGGCGLTGLEGLLPLGLLVLRRRVLRR